MLVQVKKKAQITIPLRVRETMGITEGDMLDVEIRNKEIVMKPVRGSKMKLKAVSAETLRKLEGLISVGGDALKDSEAIWDESNN